MGFTFGENWTRFSRRIDEANVAEAEASLHRLIDMNLLRGCSLVDVGAGSGLFSIAAIRAGAARVVALDRDQQCLMAIEHNARRFLQPEETARLQVHPWDILHPVPFGEGPFDVVYAWGSLHHTGAMWQAIANAARLCREGGHLIIAIYNRTPASPFWLRIKRLYRGAPRPLEFGMAAALAVSRSVLRLVSGKHPIRTGRGMNVWHDAIDWLGGWPYECATAAEVTSGLARLGFSPVRARVTRRSGCNEFTFQKRSA
jgi:2-polyprenyl-6-hydroxyphenyl methylase/3-demethylubiquinone-9 3-methyltransferase